MFSLRSRLMNTDAAFLLMRVSTKLVGICPSVEEKGGGGEGGEVGDKARPLRRGV